MLVLPILHPESRRLGRRMRREKRFDELQSILFAGVMLRLFEHKMIYGPSLRCNDGVSRDEPF
jgi:hypothetical protein